MGTWGCGIFDDDVAMDIRDLFEDALAEGLTVTEATQRILDNDDYSLDEPDDGPVILLALAALQLEQGSLDPEIKDTALAVINEGQGLDRWEENPEALEERKKILESFRQDITNA